MPVINLTMAKIIIDDTTRLCDIQSVFQRQFAYLKLEFFNFKKRNEGGFSMADMIKNSDTKVEKIRKIDGSKVLNFNGHLKTSTLEERLMLAHGLRAQVFRRTGNLWLETSQTDSFTLSKQNQMGKESTISKINTSIPEFESYHEQE